MGDLIKIDGKALEKLIDVISSGIGTLYRPRQIRREADAKAYAIKALEKAQAEAAAEARLIEFEAEDRISQRIIAREKKRQNNIDSVVEMAADNLKGKTVSDQPVDSDWATRFFDITQDVSKEEMQALWARILAREIETPSSFSLRTLEVLRNITFKEAETFERVAQFILFQNGYFIFNDHSVLDQMGIHYVDLALMTECGLLQAGSFVTKHYNPAQEDSVSGFFYGKYVVFLTLQKGTKEIRIPAVLLTKVGQEIFSLLEPEANMDYISALVKEVKKQNPSAQLQYAELLSRNGNQVTYSPPLVDL